MIRIEGLGKHFGTTQALAGIDLHVAEGEIVCLIGPSGSGKSTLLRCINQLERMDEGRIWVAGELVGYRQAGDTLHPLPDAAIARQRLRCGMVFQRFNLFAHRTVLQNVVEGPVHVLRRRRAEAMAEAIALLDRVGLADKAHAYPAALSGGQQQRVAIARALAMRPAVLLFDEPTSALDPELVGEVLAVMRGLAAEAFTMLVVTHELAFAREVADRVVFMDAGRIVEAGPADALLSTPTHPRTREFLSAVLA